jgi:hypothetical protein
LAESSRHSPAPSSFPRSSVGTDKPGRRFASAQLKGRKASRFPRSHGNRGSEFLFQLALIICLALTPPPALASPINHAGLDYYFGDLHTHTGHSMDGYSGDLYGCPDGYDCGDVSSVLQDARDVFDLDFLAITEHGNGLHAVQAPWVWEDQLSEVQAANDPEGGFVTVPGVELWLWAGNGSIRDHRNLYLFGTDEQLDGLGLDEIRGEDDAPPFTTDDCLVVFDHLETLEQTRGDILLIPHHPAIQPPAAADWTCVDPRFNPVVENYSEHGNSQWPSYPDSFDPVDPDAEQPASTVDRALSPVGYDLRLGIVGGTDSHDTRPGSVCDLDPRFRNNAVNYGGGLSVVALPEGDLLDRSAILSAMRDRRTLATSGPRIPVHFEIRSDGTPVASMGEQFDHVTSEAIEFLVSVPTADTAYVTGVTLIQPDTAWTPIMEDEPGRYVGEVDLGANNVVYALVEIDGEAYWGDQAVDCDDGGEDDREFIWTSPIWVDEIAGMDDDDTSEADDDDSAGDDDGCECDTGGGDLTTTSGVLWGLLLAALWRVRR